MACTVKFSLVLYLLQLATLGEAQDAIRFGITPWQKEQKLDELRDSYRILLDYLEKRTGKKFISVGVSDYEGLVNDLSLGKVSIAHISAVPYVLAKRENPGVEVLLSEVLWDTDQKEKHDYYYGYVLAKKERDDLTGLSSLKDKTLGLVSRESSSGYKYPMALIKSQNIDPALHFRKVYYLGSHPRVTDAIAAGSIDAGVTWTYNYQQALKKHGAIFKEIARTDPIPNVLIATHPSLGEDIRQAIKQALLEATKADLGNIPADGFIERDDSFL